MRKKILFTYTNFSTFVKTDYEILSSEHEVIKYHYKPVKGLLKTALQLFKQLSYLILNIWKFDVVFIWFADYHSFLPVFFAKLLYKKSFVVIGGYDVVRMPELGYGVFNSKIRGFCAIYSMRQSTLNLAVSNYVKRKVNWITKKSNNKLIYNCVNIVESKNIKIEKENLIITVGLIDSERTFFLKGIDTFIEAAIKLPEYRFMVIGMSKNIPVYTLKNRPENLEIIEWINHEELETYYKKAKMYCQFSRSESFGVAIAESMNFGCFPIVAHVGGMPEVVENKIFVVKKRDVETITKTIKKFMKLKNSLKTKNIYITHKTISRFSLLKRNEQINQLL